MKIAVIGATGRTGAKVVTAALEAGHELTAIVRDPSTAPAADHERLRLLTGDVRDVRSLERALDGQDAVISCVGPRSRKERSLREEGIRNTIAAARKAGVRRLVVLSAFGVADSVEELKRTTFVFSRIILPLFLKTQFADMARMEELVRESGLEWVVVRPSAMNNKPATNAVKIADGSRRAGSSIPLEDVATFMVTCLTSDAHVGAMPVISV
ncbi:MAG: hypothetical protein QOG94_3559 [Solirubrobacteraceae bacterium]|jgi:uncharacterized protein YbjT (DUF2867 family)|nr:hypothetical protein [Solirubrobacteraceae bacterium]MEA2137174.1 hypothetical protein [Solirubrobacteraceae bacterium]